jgi:hypothetical protein
VKSGAIFVVASLLFFNIFILFKKLLRLSLLDQKKSKIMLLKKSIFITITFFFLTITKDLRAQNSDTASLKNVYEKEAIYMANNTRKYIKDGKTLKVGYKYKKLAAEYKISSDALKALHIYRITQRNGTIILFSSALPFIVSMLPGVGGPLDVILIGTGAAAYYVSLVKMVNSQTHLHKSVWLYNRDVLLQHPQ